jgi:hypothetical protein
LKDNSGETLSTRRYSTLELKSSQAKCQFSMSLGALY